MSHAFCVSRAQCDAMAEVIRGLVLNQQQQMQVQPSLEDAVQLKESDATLVLDPEDQEDVKASRSVAYQHDTRVAQDARVPVGAY